MTDFMASSRRSALQPTLVAVSALLAFAAVPTFGFVFDDRQQVLGNPTLAHLGSIPDYFRHHVWSYYSTNPSYYRPLFSAWLNLNFSIFGLHPAGWHISVLCLHAIAAILVYFFVRDLFDDNTVALVAGVLFAVHPVHVESVAWVSGATDPLVAVFVLLSFLAYLRAHEFKWMWVCSLLAFVCALLSKETAVVLPVLILLHSLLLSDRRGDFRVALLRSGPYFAVLIAYCLVRIRILGQFSYPAVHLSWSGWIMSVPGVILFYLRLLVLPVQLSPFYETPYVSAPDFLHFWMPLILLVIIAALASWGLITLSAKTQAAIPSRLILFLLGLMFLFLVPALDFFALDPGEIAHDRYLYLPSVGLCAIVAYALRWAGARIQISRSLQAGTVTAIVVALGTASLAQSLYWKNDLSLYKRGAIVAPSNLNAEMDLATIYLETGHFEEGIELQKRIIQIQPDRADSYFNLGLAYYKLTQFSTAIDYFRRALALAPTARNSFYLGMALLKTGQIDQAEEALRHAVRADPSQADYHTVLGVIHKMKNDPQEALLEFEQAQKLNPENQSIQNEIVNIKRQLNQKM